MMQSSRAAGAAVARPIPLEVHLIHARGRAERRWASADDLKPVRGILLGALAGAATWAVALLFWTGA